MWKSGSSSFDVQQGLLVHRLLEVGLPAVLAQVRVGDDGEGEGVARSALRPERVLRSRRPLLGTGRLELQAVVVLGVAAEPVHDHFGRLAAHAREVTRLAGGVLTRGGTVLEVRLTARVGDDVGGHGVVGGPAEQGVERRAWPLRADAPATSAARQISSASTITSAGVRAAFRGVTRVNSRACFETSPSCFPLGRWERSQLARAHPPRCRPVPGSRTPWHRAEQASRPKGASATRREPRANSLLARLLAHGSGRHGDRARGSSRRGSRGRRAWRGSRRRRGSRCPRARRGSTLSRVAGGAVGGVDLADVPVAGGADHPDAELGRVATVGVGRPGDRRLALRRWWRWGR